MQQVSEVPLLVFTLCFDPLTKRLSHTGNMNPMDALALVQQVVVHEATRRAVQEALNKGADEEPVADPSGDGRVEDPSNIVPFPGGVS